MAEQKLTIEEQIKTRLSGDLQKNTLEFAAYLKSNDVSPESVYSCGFDYLGERVCILFVEDNGSLYVYFNGKFIHEPKSLQVSTHLKEFAHANVNYCSYLGIDGKNCDCGGRPGSSITIYGKIFDYVCHAPLVFFNPNSETYEKIKELVSIWKHNIDEMKKI